MNYETKEASLQVIGISAGVLAFLVLGSIATVTWVYTAQYHGASAVATSGRATSFRHGSDEKIGVLQDYAQVNRESDAHLHAYAWVDRQPGVVRIPIERAMELLVAGAKPASAPQEPGAGGMP